MLYTNLLLPLLVIPALAAHVPRHPKRSHGQVDLDARAGHGEVLIEARGPSPDTSSQLKKPKAKRTVKKKRQEGSLCVVPGTNTTTRIGDGNWAGSSTTVSPSATGSASSSSAQPTTSTPSTGGGSATSWTLDEAWVSLRPSINSSKVSLLTSFSKAATSSTTGTSGNGTILPTVPSTTDLPQTPGTRVSSRSTARAMLS